MLKVGEEREIRKSKGVVRQTGQKREGEILGRKRAVDFIFFSFKNSVGDNFY